jgi:hypothetical protein
MLKLYLLLLCFGWLLLVQKTTAIVYAYPETGYHTTKIPGTNSGQMPLTITADFVIEGVTEIDITRQMVSLVLQMSMSWIDPGINVTLIDDGNIVSKIVGVQSRNKCSLGNVRM